MSGRVRGRGTALLAAAVVGALIPAGAEGLVRTGSGDPEPAGAAAFVAPDAGHAGPVRGAARAGATAEQQSAPAQQAPAVTHRENRIDTPSGPVTTDIVVADLRRSGVEATLLTGAAVGERATVPEHAARAGTVAAVNGDFFDFARSNAPAGPSVRDGRMLTSAVPPGRRLAPAVPGSEPGDALTVDATGTPRVDRLDLVASATGPGGKLPIRALNTYAVPVGGIGLFTPDWNGDRAAALCGSDTDRDAPCAPDRVEVVVRDGRVTDVRPPGGGPIPEGEQILAGRDEGAAALRGLAVGDRVTVRHSAGTASGVPADTAVGGSPILRDGTPVPGLDGAERDPRSAAGVTAEGRLVLLTADGRESTSAGLTLAETAEQLRAAGAVDGVNLDGGGSSTLVYRGQVVNNPSDDAHRAVPNALGIVGG